MEARAIEFYNTPQGQVYYLQSGEQQQLKIDNKSIIDRLLDLVEDSYNDAFKALEKEYRQSKPNYAFFRYRCAHRFIRCNFGEMDTLKNDINDNGMLHLEQVKCPLRGTGDCKAENVICMPKRTMIIKGRQLQVASKMAMGMSNQQIADTLYLSINTIHNVIQSIKARLGVKNSGQIVTWYNANYHD